MPMPMEWNVIANFFFRPFGAWAGLLAVDPSDESLGYCRASLRDFPQVKFPAVLQQARAMWSALSQPGGRKAIAQRFNAGFPGDGGNESRQGRKKSLASRSGFFRPCGAYGDFEHVYPAINRWAIVGRP